MNFDKEYTGFIQHITDPQKSEVIGPVKFTKEEDAFARLFVAYLDCRYTALAKAIEDRVVAEKRDTQ